MFAHKVHLVIASLLILAVCHASAQEPQETMGWKQISTLDGKFYLEGMSLSSDGKLLAAVKPRTARRFGAVSFVPQGIGLFDTETGKELSEFKFKEDVNAFALLADGKHLATLGPSGTAVLWDIKTTRPKKRFRIVGMNRGPKLIGHGKMIVSLVASRNTAAVYVYDVGTGKVRAKLKGRYRGLVYALQGAGLSPDGNMLACAVASSAPGTSGLVETRIWNLNTGKATASIPSAGGEMIFSPDQKMLAIASAGRSLTIWNVDRKKVHAAKRPTAPLFSSYRQLAFSPNSETLVAVEHHIGPRSLKSKSLKVWDPTTLKEKKTKMPFESPRNLIFSSTWNRAATQGTSDITIWSGPNTTE